MFDIGSWEFLIIIIVALVVIGPKDLPGVVRTVSMWIRRARDLAREFQTGLEDMAREAELDKLTEDLKGDLDPEGLMDTVRQDVENTIDPQGEIRSDYDPYDPDVDEEPATEPATQPADEPSSEPAPEPAGSGGGAQPVKPDA